MGVDTPLIPSPQCPWRVGDPEAETGSQCSTGCCPTEARPPEFQVLVELVKERQQLLFYKYVRFFSFKPFVANGPPR